MSWDKKNIKEGSKDRHNHRLALSELHIKYRKHSISRSHLKA